MNISINKFKLKHEGESCYILGDGPSLKSMHLSEFNNLPSIVCGKLMFRHDFNDLKCLYYTIPEPFLFAPNFLKKHQYLKDESHIADLIKKKFQEFKGIEFFLNGSNLFSVSGDNINFIHRYLFNPVKSISKIDPFGGSFVACLTVAYLLGFKKVFLVGFDSWTNKESSDLRWFENGKVSMNLNGSDLNNDLISFYKREMDITSIILDSNNARNFEYLTYQEFCGAFPVYKENFDLTSEDVLNTLNTQPLYKIY